MTMAASVFSLPADGAAAVPPVPWERIERFVGQLTHDVRNGLNALELQLTLVGEISSDPEVMAEVKALRGTLLEVTRQLQSVKTMTGPVSPHLLNYPAADFFEDLRERFAQRQAGAAEKIAWKIRVDNASLNIDPDLSLHALLELLGNALHFGGVHSTIGFLAESHPGGGVALTLSEARESPPDVPPADWGRTPLLTTRRNAYGLGLFRVRQVIEAQGGTLHAEYSESDRVLTTAITLPGATA